MIGHMGTIWPMTPKRSIRSTAKSHASRQRTAAVRGRWLAAVHLAGGGSRRAPVSSTTTFRSAPAVTTSSSAGTGRSIASSSAGNNTNSGAFRYLDDAQRRAAPQRGPCLSGRCSRTRLTNPNMHADFFAQDVWTVNDRLTVTLGFRVGSQILSYVDSNNTAGGCLPRFAALPVRVAFQPVADPHRGLRRGRHAFPATMCIRTGTSLRGWALPMTSPVRRHLGIQGVRGPLLRQRGHRPRFGEPGWAGQRNLPNSSIRTMNGILDDTSELGERLELQGRGGRLARRSTRTGPSPTPTRPAPRSSTNSRRTSAPGFRMSTSACGTPGRTGLNQVPLEQPQHPDHD